MKKRTKKVKSVAWVKLVVTVAVALVVGIGIGMLTDPLPPSTCAARLAQIDAPSGVDQYVCYGRRPN